MAKGRSSSGIKVGQGKIIHAQTQRQTCRAFAAVTVIDDGSFLCPVWGKSMIWTMPKIFMKPFSMVTDLQLPHEASLVKIWPLPFFSRTLPQQAEEHCAPYCVHNLHYLLLCYSVRRAVVSV